MGSQPLARAGDHRILAWTTALVGLVLVGSLALVPAASSATVTSAWQAKIGAKGVNGTAKLQVYDSGTGSLTLRLVKMRPATLLPVVLHKGTCSAVGPVLARLDAIRSSSAGVANRTSSLTVTRVRAILAATRSGKVAIRVGSGSALRCGLFAALAIPMPTPPTSVGGTFYLGPYYGLEIPPGWSISSSGGPLGARLELVGPSGQKLLANSIVTTVTLDELVATIIAAVKAANGVDPERDQPITMAGVPGRQISYHFMGNGVPAYEIDAFCVNNGRAYELSFLNRAGTETADDVFFAHEVASFVFGPGF